MSVFRHFSLLILLVFMLLASACDSEKREFQTAIFAFGTLIDITLLDVTADQANIAFDRLEQNFQYYHKQWSPWETGAIHELNRKLAQGEPYRFSPEIQPVLKPMIEQAITLSERSNGLFNPTIGNLINLWQFHRHEEADIKPPAAQRIQALVDSHPLASDLRLEQDTLYSENPAVQLSLGAFAKGYGIQLAAETLATMGIRNAVINAGGDLVIRGKHGQRAWNIGIRHPRKNSIIASIEIRSGESVFTSGDYERYYFYKNKRYHHILDPRTGYPTRGFSSVTVIDDDAGVADAAATALMVAGPDNWLALARTMKLRYVLLIKENNDIIMNPAMASRVKPDKAGTHHIIVSEKL